MRASIILQILPFISACLAFGIGLSSWAAEPDSIPKPGKSRLPTTSYWFGLKTVPFNSEQKGGYLIQKLAGSEPSVSAEQEKKFKAEIGAVIATLRAPTFADYRAAQARGTKTPPLLTPWALESIVNANKALSLVEAGAISSPEDALERFWLNATQLGRGQEWFVGYVPEESHYVFKVAKPADNSWLDMRAYMDTLIKEKAAGLAGSQSFFDRGETLASVQVRKSPILVATFRLMLSTRTHNLAYPIITRFFWSEKSRSWVFHDYYELYAGKRVRFIY